MIYSIWSSKNGVRWSQSLTIFEIIYIFTAFNNFCYFLFSSNLDLNSLIILFWFWVIWFLCCLLFLIIWVSSKNTLLQLLIPLFKSEVTCTTPPAISFVFWIIFSSNNPGNFGIPWNNFFISLFDLRLFYFRSIYFPCDSYILKSSSSTPLIVIIFYVVLKLISFNLFYDVFITS